MKKQKFFLLFAVSVTKKMKKYLKKKNQLRYEKLLVYLKICHYFKTMTEENISPESRLKEIDKTTNYFINENEFMSKKHKKVSKILS